MQGRLQRAYRVDRELGRNAGFSGEISVTEMPRLSSLVLAGEQPVKVEFEFATDAFRQPVIRGHYRAELIAQCQRCLEPMEFSIDRYFELLIDATDDDVEAFQLDTVYTEDGYLDVFTVVEDELILALPIILMHEDTNCNNYLSEQKELSGESSEISQGDNPFAVLAQLKRDD